MIEPAPNQWLPVGKYVERHANPNRARIEYDAGIPRLVCNDGGVCLPIYSYCSGPAATNKFKLVKDIFTTRQNMLSLLQ